MYNPTTSKDPLKFKKVKPNTPTSPHWYDVGSLERHLYAHIKDSGKDLAIGKYIGTFSGLKRPPKQAAVREHLAYQMRYLSDFAKMDEEVRHDAIGQLLLAMQRETDPPKHDALGKLGMAHFKAGFEKMYGIQGSASFHYQMTEGYQNGLPWRFEVALAKVARPAQLFTGINYSPTFGDPLDDMLLETLEEYGYGLVDLLGDLHALPWESAWDLFTPDDEQPYTAVAIHFISPVVSYQDLGKSSIDTRGLHPAPKQKTIATALWEVSKTLYKEEKRRRKQASSPVKEKKPPGEREPDQKEAAFMVMEEAVRHVSGNGTLPYGARRLFYRVRDMIPAITSKRFNPDNGYKYFSQTVLTEYQQKHGKLEGLYYDPRGRLHEPHTKKTVDIGTREVEAYNFPNYVFDKILFVEKKGQMPLLEAANIAERYDMAIMTGEGFATEAARVLLESASKEQNYQLFVLHDADPAGYSIARTVQEETTRMPGYKVEVVDLGLKVEKVVDLEGIHPEEYVTKQPLSKPLLDTLKEGSLAHEFFTGEEIEVTEDDGKKKKKAWRRKRIELDNLSAPQVIAYLERALEENGVRGKVVPPDDYLKDDVRSKYEAEVHSEVRCIVDEIASTGRIQKIVTRLFRERYKLDDARQWIEEGFGEDDTLNWETPLKHRLSRKSVELEAELKQAVQRVFEKMLSEE
jgi:hypothetical protein